MSRVDSPMMRWAEAQTTVGQVLTKPARRDAVHFALAPMVAYEDLDPGAHVKFTQRDNTKVRSCEQGEGIGIVDPFLARYVKQGETFWVFLYPNTISSLRHEWEHPAFPAMIDTNADTSAADRQTAIKVADALLMTPQRQLLENFAEEIDVTYEELLEGALDYIKTGSYMSHGSKFEGVQTPDGFWEAYDFVTQTKSGFAKTRESFFSCSC